MNKRFISLVMSVILILTCAVPAMAVDGESKINPAFTVGEVNAFSEPMKASALFNVEQLICFSFNDNMLLNVDDDSVTVVSTMDALVTTAKAMPFAALVIDTSAKDAVDYDALAALAKIQHLVLIMGYTAPDKNEAEFMDEHGVNMSDYNFASYFVSNDGDVTVFDLANVENVSDLLIFANRTKDDLFIQYSSAVGEYDYLAQNDSSVLINEDGIDLDNPFVPIQPLAWTWADNNRVQIFSSIIAGSTSGYVYDAVNGSVSVTIYNGEAVLHTGTTQVGSTGITWYKVRVWKVSGSTATLTTGWTRDVSLAIAGDQTNDMYFWGQNYANGNTVVKATGYSGYKIRSSTTLYNSAGTSVGTLAAGSYVWIADDQGHAGNSNAHYVSISAYSTTATGTKTVCTSTTFVDAGFKTGSVSTYKIYTQ